MMSARASDSETALRARDREARHFAQTEFAYPLVLEAGAGTGKTTTLVARIVVWLLGQGWERAEQYFREKNPEAPPVPYRIAQRVLQRTVAITFTEKAAAEMANRVAVTLHCLAQGSTPIGVDSDCLPPEVVLRSRELLSAIDQLQASTIHAFCRRLLAEFPIEAGLRPDFELDSGEGAGEGLLHEIVNEVLEARLRDEAEQGDGLLTRLCEIKINLADIPQTIIQLHDSGMRAEHLQIDPLSASAIEALRNRMSLLGVLEVKHSERLQHLASSIPRSSARAKEVHPALEAVFSALHRWQGSSFEAFDEMCKAVAKAWSDKASAALKAWEEGDWNTDEVKALPSEERMAISASLQHLPALLDHVRKIDPPSLRVLHDLLVATLGEVQVRARAQGIEKFSDLLQDTRTLLVKNPGIARLLRSRIDQLMVDEFQDTDEVQCEIIEILALQGDGAEIKAQADAAHRSAPADAETWGAQRSSAQTNAREASFGMGLFLVGDPKQSIYGWRSADLRAYDAFVAKVCQRGGKIYPLSVNYRSCTPILEEVERVVGAAMQREEGFQPAFETLLNASVEPCRANSQNENAASMPASRASIEYWSTLQWDDKKSAPSKPKADDGAALEAEAIAHDLRRLHTGGVEWKSIGILFRSTTDMEVYLGALRKLEIPYNVEGGKQYYQRREVVEAASLVCSILDPNDHLALLSWLRSVWVGIPDAALPLLWDSEFTKAASNLHKKVSPELLAKVDEVAAMLAERREFAAFSGLDRIADWQESLKLALHSLAALRASLATDCAEDFVEKIRRIVLVEPIAAARSLGAFRLANLERFFRELRDLFEMTHGNVSEILHQLRDPIFSQSEGEDARPREGLEDTVQVMTIHKAKGLEFAHTYVVQMGKSPPPDRGDKVGVELALGHCEYVALRQRTLAADGLLAATQKVVSRERVRALYVAMTRAKHRLVLIGSWSKPKDAKKSGGEKPCDVSPGKLSQTTVWEAKSFADLFLLRGTGFPSFEEKMQEIAQTESAAYEFFTNDGHVRWVLMSRRPGEADTDLSDTKMRQVEECAMAQDEIEARSTRVRALRSAARKYRARAFRMAASRVSAFLSSDEDEQGAQANGFDFDIAQRDERTAFAPTPKSDPSKTNTPRALAWNGAQVQESRAAGARIARVVGTAIHRALENLDLHLDPASALAIEREALPRAFDNLPNATERERALEKANQIFDALETNGLLQRLFALRDAIVARELPLLLPPKIVELGENAPLGFIAGTLDLLYRDPARSEAAPAQAGAAGAAKISGDYAAPTIAPPTLQAAPARWVVVDYKTDFVTTSDEIDERVQHYAMQGELYCRAVQQALGLDEKPRFELWFLAAGVVRQVT